MHRRRQLLRADPGRGHREPAGEAARGLGEVQVGHQDHVLADGIRPGLARLARPHHGDALAQDRGDLRHGEINKLTSEVGYSDDFPNSTSDAIVKDAVKGAKVESEFVPL